MLSLIGIIREALLILSMIQLPCDAIRLYQRVDGDFHAVRSAYLLGVSPYIVGYYHKDDQPRPDAELISCGNSSRSIMYMDFLNEKNIIGSINGCLVRINSIAQILGESNADASAKLVGVLARSSEFKLTPYIEKHPLGECECGGRFSLYASTNTKRCSSCGIAVLHESIFEETPFPGQDAQKVKQGRHYPCMHCKLWVSRIQAWAVVEIPRAVIAQLEIYCKRDGLNLKKMTCERVRKYLKEGKAMKLSKWNNFVPLIRKILTDISPPQLTSDELDALYGMFNKIAAVLKRARPNNNINYYPYIIYKILDHQLPKGPRKSQILECIHLQSSDTMRIIDNIFKQQVYAEIAELRSRSGEETSAGRAHVGDHDLMLHYTP
jgi:hypothetical protein